MKVFIYMRLIFFENFFFENLLRNFKIWKYVRLIVIVLMLLIMNKLKNDCIIRIF